MLLLVYVVVHCSLLTVPDDKCWSHRVLMHSIHKVKVF